MRSICAQRDITFGSLDAAFLLETAASPLAEKKKVNKIVEGEKQNFQGIKIWLLFSPGLATLVKV